MDSKRCRGKCGEVKSLDCFNSKKDAADGLYPLCKDCFKEYRRAHYLLYPEKKRKLNNTWKHRNPAKVRASNKKRRSTEKARKRALEVASAYGKQPHVRAKLTARVRQWREANPELVRAYQRAYRETKLKKNPSWVVCKNLSSRLLSLLKTSEVLKTHSILHIIGCTRPELISHLEKQFKPGMTWANYGKYGWHVDHIRPCASYDLTDIEQQKSCFNWKNLQPLFAIENIRKGKKYVEITASI